MASDVLDTPEAGGLVVRGGALRVAGFAGGTLLSLAGIVLLTRHLGTEDFGRFQTVLSLVTVVQAVTDLGMATLGVREWTQRSGPDRLVLMRVLLGLRLALTTVGVALGAGIAVASGFEGAQVLGVGLMGAGLVLLVVQSSLQIPLAAGLRLGTVAAIDLVRNGLTTALFVVLVVAGAGLTPFFAVTIPVHLVLLVWTAVLVRGTLSLRPSFAWDEWRALLAPTLVFALATAVGTIYLYTAQVLTAIVADADETGLFSAAFRVFVIAALVPGVLVSSAFPLLSRAARDDPARLANALRGLFAGTALLGGAACVGLVAGASPVIDVVAGDEFGGADAVLRIQAVALLLTFVIATWGFTLLALHRHRDMVWANVAAFAVSAVTVVIGASSSGAEGAAWGTLLGELTLATGYAIAVSRARPELRPSPVAFAKVLAVTGGALCVLFVPGLPPVADAALALVVYAALALALRAIPPEVRDLRRPA